MDAAFNVKTSVAVARSQSSPNRFVSALEIWLQRDATWGEACIRNKELGKKPPKAHTRVQRTPARQRRPTKTRAANRNPPARAPHRHLTTTPHTATCATKATGTDLSLGPHGGRNRNAQRTSNGNRGTGATPAPAVTTRHRIACTLGRNYGLRS